MRNRNIRAIVIATLAILAAVQTSSAYYSPSQGRFLTRDPLYEKGAIQVRMVAAPKNSERSATRFLPRDPVPVGTEYSFVDNQPVNAVDPMGLDRYVTEVGGVHTGICVDIWGPVPPSKCCTQGPYAGQKRSCMGVIGRTCFDFSAAWQGLILPIVYGPGQVVESSTTGKNIVVTIKSRCKEDRDLLDKMRDQVAHPDGYSLFAFNCNRWTEYYIEYGLDGKVPAQPCGGDVDCK